jgi:hypothetical protein
MGLSFETEFAAKADKMVQQGVPSVAFQHLLLPGKTTGQSKGLGHGD